jgi:hypothetical protein
MHRKSRKGGKKGGGTDWAGPRRWTAGEVRELKRLARKKKAARKIARKLKRTEGATRQKAFSIGLSLSKKK